MVNVICLCFFSRTNCLEYLCISFVCTSSICGKELLSLLSVQRCSPPPKIEKDPLASGDKAEEVVS